MPAALDEPRGALCPPYYYPPPYPYPPYLIEG
jgi:hypothetical protein